MMTFETIASSSSGNAYVVKSGRSRLLIEAGIAHRTLLKALGGTHTVIAALLSHEHKDHSKCVRELLLDGMPVYMSLGTALALDCAVQVAETETERHYMGTSGVRLMEPGKTYQIGDFKVRPFRTFHDCAEPFGFFIVDQDGESLVFATDTVNMAYRFLPPVTILAIEANHNAEILARSERMPIKTRERVANTHMEISRLCRQLRRMDLSRCREIVLLHLSDATSNENDFIYRVERAVPKGIKVSAAPRKIERT